MAEFDGERLMEGIWEVADVDADEEEDADKGADEDEDMSSSSQSSHASKFEVEGGGLGSSGSAAPETTVSMVRTNSWRQLDTSQNCRCRLGWCTSAMAGRSIAGAAAIA